MSKDQIGHHATTVSMIDDALTVVFHSTPIVRVFEDRIELNNGGFFTKTTKVRMNQASMAFNLGFEIKQIKGNWFAFVGDIKIPFTGEKLILQRGSNG